MMNNIAIIDTETNWENKVMSIGVVVANPDTFEIIDSKYYVITPEYKVGGMYSFELIEGMQSDDLNCCERKAAIIDARTILVKNNVFRIYAYNASFDKSHLPELADFGWYDIMRIAAYKQYNKCIPKDAECCKTGRLKRDYGMENILAMLMSDCNYCETHNALKDALDELQIIKLLGLPISVYDIAKLN